MTVSLISDHIAQPHTVRFKGVGMLPNKLKTAVPGFAGSRCFAVCGAPHALLANRRHTAADRVTSTATAVLSMEELSTDLSTDFGIDQNR